MLGAGAVSLSRVCVDLQVRFHLIGGIACAELLVCVRSQLFSLHRHELAPVHPLGALLTPAFLAGFLTDFQTHFSIVGIYSKRAKGQGPRTRFKDQEPRTKG